MSGGTIRQFADDSANRLESFNRTTEERVTKSPGTVPILRSPRSKMGLSPSLWQWQIDPIAVL
jgi:hypothetical protein